MQRILFIFSIVPFFILQGCSEHKEQAREISPKTPVKPVVKLATVQSDHSGFSVTLPGELMPYEQVNIYPKIRAFVKNIYVDRGSTVRKGQVLAKLEAPEVGEQYAARQSAIATSYQKYLFSKQAYERLKEAAKKSGAVAGIELDRAYAQLLGDSAAYQSTRSDAAASGQINRYLTLIAPFDGVITGRFVSEGALVGDASAKAEPLFSLVQQNRLRLTVAIPEKDAQSLPLGTKATFTVVDFPGKTFSGILSRNSGALDMDSRSVIAEFDVDAAAQGLRAGQYAKVTLQLRRPQPTLWVPTSSVVQAQSGIFVIKAENGIARRVPVQIGVSKDSLTEVFGDLQSGDQILQKGSEEIKEGAAVQAR